MKSIIDIFNGSLFETDKVFQPKEFDWNALARQIDAMPIDEIKVSFDTFDKEGLTLEDLIVFWKFEHKEKHKDITKYLYFIRQIYWEIEHVTKACKPKRHNNHLSWIATGTYYHYLSSDDEDSNHSNNAVIDNGQRIDQFIHRTQKMVA